MSEIHSGYKVVLRLYEKYYSATHVTRTIQVEYRPYKWTYRPLLGGALCLFDTYQNAIVFINNRLDTIIDPSDGNGKYCIFEALYTPFVQSTSEFILAEPSCEPFPLLYRDGYFVLPRGTLLASRIQLLNEIINQTGMIE